MQIGMVGLGRMGGNMVERMIEDKHEVAVYDRDSKAVERIGALGARPCLTLGALVDALSAPRVVWVMVPSGDPTETTITTLLDLLSPGDIIIDGGNSNFRDSMRRAELSKARGVSFCDAGTSGGIWGLKNGYCLMVGGPDDAVHYVEPIFKTLAPPDGYLHTGPVGSGHFVKMVHNGIEYGLLAAYGEGFEVMQESQFDLNLPAISELWKHGSVVRSWLLELLSDAYGKNPDLKNIRGFVEDSGEGRWTVAEAINENVPAPVITMALLSRIQSRQDESYSAKVIAALRNEFGGHAIKPE
ncbi:MAG: phosphogluconate dehydrogenase (NAD(+)-dependent, decarboxylating) [Sulfobacillus sp.]